MKELLLFHVGMMQYGIDLALVKSIHSAKSIVVDREGNNNPINTRLDKKEPALYNLLLLFEKGNSSRIAENEKLIIVEIASRPVGLIVSRVDLVVEYDHERFEPLAPIFRDISQSCFSGILKLEGSLILLLTPEGIVDAARKIGGPHKGLEMTDDGNEGKASIDEYFYPEQWLKQPQNESLDQRAG